MTESPYYYRVDHQRILTYVYAIICSKCTHACMNCL